MSLDDELLGHGPIKAANTAKEAIDALFTAVSARLVVCVELMEGDSDDCRAGLAMLKSLAHQMPDPTPRALEIARYGVGHFRNSDAQH